jgi:hypothetical protein
MSQRSKLVTPGVPQRLQLLTPERCRQRLLSLTVIGPSSQRLASKITEAESGLFVALLHWHDGRWRISALREQTSAKKLRELNVRPGAN